MVRETPKGEATRHLILDAALEVASVGGLESLTIGDLATRLSMSKSGLFAHFGAKQELILAVLRHAVDRFVSTVVAPALKKPRGEPRIRTLFEAWIAWDRALPGGCVLQAAAAEYDDVEGPIRDYVVASERDWLDTLTQVASAAVQSRAFRADVDPRLFAFELMNTLAGYRRHARLLRDPDAEALTRASFEALLARSAASPA
ncbi:MAG: TetR/AcrR family transcriptional regulator [Deltaproteobacteria bacterium]|nr:TetR/AcrR family transcriptional regulator [Deltaproteobacteria bacterium]